MTSVILISGLTGFVGSHIVLAALQAGYQVRCPIRRKTDLSVEETKRLLISTMPALATFYTSKKLEVYVVEKDDLEKVAIWEQLLHSVEYLIHSASPTPVTELDTDNWHEAVIEAAKRITVAPIYAAKKIGPSSKLRRIIITSSSSCLKRNLDRTLHSESNLIANDEIYATDPNSQIEAYLRAKDCAFVEVQKLFVEQRIDQSNFDIITIHPSYVIGHSLTVNQDGNPTSPSGSTSLLWMYLHASSVFFPMVATFVGANDVAKAHINALKLSIPKDASFFDRAFVLALPTMDWKKDVRQSANQALIALQKDYPQNHAPKSLSFGENVNPSDANDIDGSKAAVKLLDGHYESFDATLYSIFVQMYGKRA